MQIIHRYYRDEKEIPYEEWTAAFDEDIEVEKKNNPGSWGWFIPEGDSHINGHSYKIREEKIFPNAKETLYEIFCYGDTAEIMEAVTRMSEQDARDFLYYFRRARIEYENFILEDDEDYEWGNV